MYNGTNILPTRNFHSPRVKISTKYYLCILFHEFCLKNYFRRNQGGKIFSTGPDSCQDDSLLMKVYFF